MLLQTYVLQSPKHTPTGWDQNGLQAAQIIPIILWHHLLQSAGLHALNGQRAVLGMLVRLPQPCTSCIYTQLLDYIVHHICTSSRSQCNSSYGSTHKLLPCSHSNLLRKSLRKALLGPHNAGATLHSIPLATLFGCMSISKAASSSALEKEHRGRLTFTLAPARVPATTSISGPACAARALWVMSDERIESQSHSPPLMLGLIIVICPKLGSLKGLVEVGIIRPPSGDSRPSGDSNSPVRASGAIPGTARLPRSNLLPRGCR